MGIETLQNPSLSQMLRRFEEPQWGLKLEIPKENIRFADTILGFLLGTIISAIIQFFYGSSLGSKKATEALINKG